MSRRPRFRETGKDSFFGNLVYERIIEKDHSLVTLKALFDWESLGGELIRLYQGKGVNVVRAAHAHPAASLYVSARDLLTERRITWEAPIAKNSPASAKSA